MLNIRRLELGSESYKMEQLAMDSDFFRDAGAYESTAGLVDLQRVIGFVAVTTDK